MAKFDITPTEEMNAGPKTAREANYEPAPTLPLRTDSTRMHTRGVALRSFVPPKPGFRTPGGRLAILACFLGVMTSRAVAEPIAPDAPTRSAPAVVPPTTLPPSWDLDGIYVWLGPTGAASRVASQWDSTVGGDLAIVRVREQESLAAVGATLGASRWTARGGGRIWLDALVGTRLGGRMIGASAGAIVELSDLAHPRLGGSIGVWGFVGVTPFARVGAVAELGAFAEIGLHIALPVIRRR